jgi:hypothetical protein
MAGNRLSGQLRIASGSAAERQRARLSVPTLAEARIEKGKELAMKNGTI